MRSEPQAKNLVLIIPGMRKTRRFAQHDMEKDCAGSSRHLGQGAVNNLATSTVEVKNDELLGKRKG